MYTNNTWCISCRWAGLPEHSSWTVGRVEHTQAQRQKTPCAEKGRLGQIRWRSMSCLQCAQPKDRVSGNQVLNKIHDARPSPCQDKHGQPHRQPHVGATYRHSRVPSGRIARARTEATQPSLRSDCEPQQARTTADAHCGRVMQKPENGRQKSPGTAVT